MTKKALLEKIETLNEAEAQLDEISRVIEALKDEIKAEMLRKKLDEYEVGRYTIRWTSVLSNQFDTKAFKESHAKLYKEFTKQVSSRRFKISK